MRIAARAGLVLSLVLTVAVGWPPPADTAARADKKPPAVPAEEYPFYDLVVESKYLAPGTTLVLIERLTVARLEKEERTYLDQEFFEAQDVFGRQLPAALLHDFFVKLRTPARLEAKFDFGVQYRFFSNGVPEEPEVSLAPIPAALRPGRVQEEPRTIGVLRFSRVGFTPRDDQALVYVEEERPDGTGGGLLVWFHRRGKVWMIADTEVLWMARTDEERAP
jgi:hypothetical protein